MRRQDGFSVSFEQPDGLRIFWGIGDPVASGGYEPAQLRLIERLLPHIHRCVVIRQALAAADALDAGLTGLLDRDRVGVVQLDRDGVLDAWLPADRSRLLLLARAAGLVGQAPEWRFDDGTTALAPVALGTVCQPVGVRTSDFGGGG